MKLAIFGGTGKTGQHLVQQALDAGHHVVMLARTPAKVTTKHENLHIVKGDVKDNEAVSQVIQGADAVLSVLGPTQNKPDYVISKGTDVMLSAMKTHDVKRLIISAGAGVRDPHDKPGLIDRVAGVVLNLVSKHVVEDMKQVVEKVRSSDRDWTIVRVPMLTDQPAKNTFKVGYVGDITPRIARADMASFMLKQLDEVQYIGKAPAISN